MYTVLTHFQEPDKVLVKTEKTDDVSAAKGAFCIYIMHPECCGCDVITAQGQVILHWEEQD